MQAPLSTLNHSLFTYVRSKWIPSHALQPHYLMRPKLYGALDLCNLDPLAC